MPPTKKVEPKVPVTLELECDDCDRKFDMLDSGTVEPCDLSCPYCGDTVSNRATIDATVTVTFKVKGVKQSILDTFVGEFISCDINEEFESAIDSTGKLTYTKL